MLPPDYIYHLSLLVSAMHILLGDIIPIADVKVADEQSNLFYYLVPELYSEELCTANKDILIHLSGCVLNWGPLWAYSCFGFESMNGHLRANCHGARYVLPQLVHTIHTSPELMAFIHSLSGKPSFNCVLEVKGRVSQKKMDGSLLAAIKSAGFVSGSVDSIFLPCCNSIRFKSILYSVAPKKKNYRNGSFCIFKHNSELKF